MKKIAYVFVGLLTIGSIALLPSCSKDKCKDVTCQNGGTCNDDDGSCTCATGYEGANCETAMRDKFIGTFKMNGNVNCNVTGSTALTNVTVTVSNSSTSIQKMVIAVGGSFSITATLNSSTSFTIDQTTIGTFTYSGNGSISGIQLSLTINEADSSVPETCVYTLSGPKQ
jgi:hypothetical protein